ncbi:EthD family reductase [Nocardioides bruguierae]|uniref:EthD family reductase n=1 Tax=Nocardioides bruguierae TaxID=2945102 RepID=A0A9X2DBR2_9ACTN|nr:EthD family reductase [Nocardioides bruguierae]MCM0622760.1 EthD family reductase [Nocardioides bruguierae]
MIKMTMFLKRAEGISQEAFVAHHVNVHGPLMRSIPETRKHLLRYTQTHSDRREVPGVRTADFDGTAELWFDTPEGLQAVMGSETFRTVVAADEPNFLDRTATLVMVGEPEDVVGGATTEATSALPLGDDADSFGPLPRGVNHVGVTVPDLDAATDFLRAAFDGKTAYDGLRADQSPRAGEETERQLGLPSGAKIVRQRMVQIGVGPGLEVFEIESPAQAPPAGLADLGLNHVSVYVDDIEAALRRAVAAGATALSEPHANSAHEDTKGNASVYVRAPWGSLFELQTIPNGHWYDERSEARAWVPPAR